LPIREGGHSLAPAITLPERRQTVAPRQAAAADALYFGMTRIKPRLDIK
jgi:hypothetical protein